MRYKVRVTPALLRAIIKAETPQGWTVKFTNNTGGYTYKPKRLIAIPRLKHGYRTLWVFFHECAHALRHAEGTYYMPSRALRIRPSVNNSSHEEWIAETYAMEKLTAYGFPIAPTHLQIARANVRVYVRHEKALGLPIYIPVEHFAREPRRAS